MDRADEGGAANGPPTAPASGRRGGGPGSRPSLWVGVVVVLVLLQGVTTYLAFDTRSELAATREELATTRNELETATDELAAARARLDELQQAPGATGDSPHEDAEGSDGGLGGFLDELFGRDDGGLFGDSDTAALAQCSGAGDLGDLFGGSDEEPPGDIPAIAAAVEEIRGLEFTGPVDPTFLPPDQVADRIAELLRQDLTPEIADREERELAALGAIPEDLDLIEVTEEALRAQVAGFYVPETGELVVRTTAADDLATSDVLTLAHELEHALADQALGLPIDHDVDPTEADAALAALSLIEGDATLTMQRYATEHLSIMDQLGLLTAPEVLGSQEQLTGLPHHLASTLLFPYLEGLSFACGLFLGGGFDAIDAAYRDPPTTSAQILFPERYRAGEEPVDPPDPGRLGEPWAREQVRTFGAAELMWLLEAPGGSPDRAIDQPRERVSAWAGGELHLWVDGEASAVALALAERDAGSAPDLCGTLAAWAGAAWPDAAPTGVDGADIALDGERDVVIRCDDGTVHIGIAPTLADAGRLATP